MAKKPKGKKHHAHLLMLMATLLISTSFPVCGFLAPKLDPALLTLFRFVMATLFFAPLVWTRYHFRFPALVDLGRYALLSGCMVGFFWCMFLSLRTTTPLNTGAIFTLIPGVGGFLAFFLVRERIRLRGLVALVLGAAGAVWVVFRGDYQAFLSLNWNRGDLIFFAGCLLYACYNPLVQRLYQGEPMVVMTFWTLFTGASWLLVLSFPQLLELNWHSIEKEVYYGVGYLAVFTTLITFYVGQHCNMVIGSNKVMAYTYLTPALVFILGVLLDQEALEPMTMLGVAVSAIATFVLQREKNP